MQLDELPVDVLDRVVTNLNSDCDLRAITCTNQKFRNFVVGGWFWQRLCERRWHNPHAELYTSQNHPHRALYLDGNGASTPLASRVLFGGGRALTCTTICERSSGSFLTTSTEDGEDHHPADHQATVECHQLHENASGRMPFTLQQVLRAVVRQTSWACCMIDPSCVATGHEGGLVEVHSVAANAEPDSPVAPSKAGTSRDGAAVDDEPRCPEATRASAIQLPAENAVGALLAPEGADTLWASNCTSLWPPSMQRPAEAVRLWTIDAQHGAAVACQGFLDDYDLFTMCQHPSGPNVAIGGGRRAGSCDQCYYDGLPWTCQHGSSSQRAMLGVFDMRTAAMQQHCMLQHCSLHPCMVTAPLREHYLFISHSTVPLAVWDLRKMMIPLHESPRLNNHPSPARAAELSLRLPRPSHPVTNQALQLTASADTLLGQALNGNVWRWDLSCTLGWADASHKGCWETFAHSSEAEEGEWVHPTPLGMIMRPPPECQPCFSLVPGAAGARMALITCMDRCGVSAGASAAGDVEGRCAVTLSEAAEAAGWYDDDDWRAQEFATCSHGDWDEQQQSGATGGAFLTAFWLHTADVG